jgi:hypothetical protein
MDRPKVKGLELMSWLGEVKKKLRGASGKSYVPKEIAGTVARTGSRRRLKGADSAGDQGLVPLQGCEWPGGCLC